MALTYTAIATVTVGSGGAANIDFSSIPATYTDLCLKFSLRNANASVSVSIKFNGSATTFTSIELTGSGSSVFSQTGTNSLQPLATDGTNWTASTFSNGEIYIPNYAGSANKSFYVDSVTENNATTAYAGIQANLWSTTSAINQVTLTAALSGNFAQYSTATLYGIKNTV